MSLQNITINICCNEQPITVKTSHQVWKLRAEKLQIPLVNLIWFVSQNSHTAFRMREKTFSNPSQMQFCSRTLKYLIDSFDVWWIGIRTSIKCGPDLDSVTELECGARDGNIVNIVGSESESGLSWSRSETGAGSDSARGLGLFSITPFNRD